jgi:putative transcriptional regulator
MLKVIEKPATGSLLAAEPFLDDPNFERSIVLITDHKDDEGSIGFVINKPLDIHLDDIVLGFPSLNTSVFHGGPVQQDNLYFIHRKGDLIPGSQLIKDDLYWGGDLEPLKEMIKCKLLTANDIRFFLGYSGWGLGQLSAEIEEKSWLVLEHSDLNIFENKADELWKNLLLELGGTYSLWANSPVDPSLN